MKQWTQRQSVFILKPDSVWNILQSSFSAPLPPPYPQFLCFSLPRETVRVFRSAQYPTETQVEETDRHIEDCQPAEIKAGREETTARLQQTDFQRKKRWLKEKLGYIKVQAKLKCPNKVQWSAVNWDALFFLYFYFILHDILQLHNPHCDLYFVTVRKNLSLYSVIQFTGLQPASSIQLVGELHCLQK